MIRVISSLLLVCLYAVSAAASSGGTPKTLKIMAYNIQHGADATTRVDLMRTAEAIRAVAPDIVFLSEVDQHWRRSGMVDQPQVLAEALGMPYVHFDPALVTRLPGVTNPGRTARYGNAFLSKVPFRQTGAVPLPRRGINEPRNVLWVDVDVSGQTIRLFGTHLSLDTQERRTQLQTLGTLLTASPYPALVAGDFNSPPQRLKNEASFLWQTPWNDAHTAMGQGQGLTFPVPSPTSRIDYIFVHDRLMPALSLATTPDLDASDHYPVVVELTFP